MKQITIILLALFLIACEQEKKPTYSVINGSIENNFTDNILIKSTDFERKIPVSPEGLFSDTLNLKQDGFYQLYLGREQTGVYLEKGKNLTIHLNANQFDESIKFTGDLASANNYLAEKYLWNETNLNFKELFSLPEEDFKQKLDANQKTLDTLYKAHKIDNENFRKLLKEEDTYAKAALVESYLEAHRYFTGVEDFQVDSNFYDYLKDINFKDTLAYRNSVSYQNLLDSHFNRVVNEELAKNDDDDHTLLFLKRVNKDLPDGYAKDEIMINHLQYGLKPDKNLDSAFNIYKNSNPNPENLAKLKERYLHLQTITEGKPSPTFNYENHKGGTTSLVELKGKYVYIDVWATWCGPCLREIPFLKEIEQDYKGKNIQFVGISIDEPKDYEKWREMVTEKSLVGLQLMADNNWQSQFVKDYGILGIPRFILIDPQGNIVSADAPRPSDPLLKKTLDALL